MFATRNSFRVLTPVMNRPMTIARKAGIKHLVLPKKFDIEFPERPKLKIMEKVPQYPAGFRPFKLQKKLRLMRGPEPFHTTLVHKQYGIVATGGGRMAYKHFEMVRMSLIRKLDYDRMFAIWRIDAPWQPITKKSQGQRMGGGKGAIDHYVTPVRAGRVIVEVGGQCEYIEVERILQVIAKKLPFDAIAVSHEKLNEIQETEERLERENLNPWTFKYIVQNNLGGCLNWISPVDKLWFGKYR
ncbi:39S ribosomal protein L16, mitochondrial [Orussus abietinus]|uniref:39S ribosomal protein L16, mitochondrial n=1 Tax=Orussus abietinus TaxID=222816 RepID=UPI00062662AD|nr:39S ribosomal protein L16, mitochondrial [Orussus abietinus]